MPFKPTWNDEKIAALMDCHNRGLSATQAGVELGVSRNAVIGKLHRLGIVSRIYQGGKVGIGRSKKKRAKRERTPTTLGPNGLQIRNKKVLPPSDIVWTHELNPAANVDLLALEDGMCKWPINDHLYCGAPIILKRKPYCSIHSGMSGDKLRQNRMAENDLKWKSRPTRGRFY